MVGRLGFNKTKNCPNAKVLGRPKGIQAQSVGWAQRCWVGAKAMWIGAATLANQYLLPTNHDVAGASAGALAQH